MQCKGLLQPEPKVLTRDQYNLFNTDFSSIDTDHTNAIDVTELGALLSAQLHRTPTQNELRVTMKQFDKNNDGLVSFHEYVTAVCGSGWSTEGMTQVNIELIFERYATPAKQQNARAGRGVRGGGGLSRGGAKKPARGKAAPVAQCTLESRSRMSYDDVVRVANKCNILAAQHDAEPAVGSKLLRLPAIQQMWSPLVGNTPGAVADLEIFNEILSKISKIVDVDLDSLVDHMCKFGSNPGSAPIAMVRADSELQGVIDRAAMHFEPTDEEKAAEKAKQAAIVARGKEYSNSSSGTSMTRAQLEAINNGDTDEAKLRNLNTEYAESWNTTGFNDTGIDHNDVAVDGRELFERFAAFGTGRQFRRGAEEDENTGQLQNSEIDSGGFIKFFRDCKLLGEPPDNMSSASVDIWWAKLKNDLPKDERGAIHVDYDAFREHVLHPLADNKKMGSQLMISICLSRLPKARTNL